MTHNLLRAAATLASTRHGKARGATLRRQLVAIPARLTRPQRRPVLHLPAHWPWTQHCTALWHTVFSPATGPPAAQARPETTVEKLGRPAGLTRSHPPKDQLNLHKITIKRVHGSRLSGAMGAPRTSSPSCSNCPPADARPAAG